MGRIAQVLEFTRRVLNGNNVAETKADPGGNANKTFEHFAPVGDDSQPLAGDFVATADSSGSGREHVTGYSDPKNAGKAAAGEVRRYARNPADGSVIAVVWLRNDGTVELGLTPDDFVALASRVLDELESVKADFDALKTAYDGHKHSSPAGGTTGTPDTMAPSAHTPASVASSTVKVKS